MSNHLYRGLLSQSPKTLLAAYAGLPTPSELDALIEDSFAAEARGYYTPDEDERLRETFARYLAIRVSLWDVIQSHRKASSRVQDAPDTACDVDLAEFGMAFCAAEIIVGTGEYLIDLARARDIVWRKLDEAEPRYGLPRKQFTRLYRQLTSAFRMYGYYRARDVFDAHREEILGALRHVGHTPVAEILVGLNLPAASRGDHLRRYRRFLRHSLKRRHDSAFRKILFSIFEMLGSDIADLKIPLAKPPAARKRVTDDIRMQLRDFLQPGDIFVTRHDDAMSNLFLPGFWPHAALWLGAEDADFLEAKKDGVLLRHMDETLQVDAFVVLRPDLDETDMQEALRRARTHVGKLYDFVFDFSTSDRMVCTEVAYRTYHGIGPIQFELTQQAGRYCLSAEDLLNQSIANGWMSVVAIYGVDGNEFFLGPEARQILRRSFASRF